MSRYSRYKLIHLIDKEKAENEKSQNKDPGFHELFEARSFRLVELDKSPLITLERHIDGFDVEVTFKAVLPPEPENEDSFILKEPIKACTDFQVYIQNSSNPLKLLFDCSILSSKFYINGMLVSPDFSGYSRDRLHMQGKIYKGPPFYRLKRDLHASSLEFLSYLGINNELSIFIEACSAYKENQLYLSWLSELKSFIS